MYKVAVSAKGGPSVGDYDCGYHVCVVHPILEGSIVYVESVGVYLDYFPIPKTQHTTQLITITIDTVLVRLVI